MDRQIIYYYRRGVASYLIAKKFGVSNNYVRKLLTKNGVELRGHGITNKMSANSRTPEENRELTKRASEANKDSVHTERHRTKLALSRERSPKIDPTYELPLINLCRKMSVAVVPQKSFSKFNVDLYLPDESVVIEIFGGGFHNKKDAVEQFNNKIKYLSKINVPVLVVWADKLNYSPENILRVARSVREPLTIINGDGSTTTRGVKDITF